MMERLFNWLPKIVTFIVFLLLTLLSKLNLGLVQLLYSAHQRKPTEENIRNAEEIPFDGDFPISSTYERMHALHPQACQQFKEGLYHFLPWAPVIGAGLTLAYYGLQKTRLWAQPMQNTEPRPYTTRPRDKRVNFGS